MSTYTFTPHELRIGSVVNYVDTSEGSMIATLDWQDLKWLTEQPDYFNQCHQPILITPDLLVKMGLKKQADNWHAIDDIQIESVSDKIHRVHIRGHLIKWVGYVHELQNIVHELIGVWLELKENEQSNEK